MANITGTYVLYYTNAPEIGEATLTIQGVTSAGGLEPGSALKRVFDDGRMEEVPIYGQYDESTNAIQFNDIPAGMNPLEREMSTFYTGTVLPGRDGIAGAITGTYSYLLSRRRPYPGYILEQERGQFVAARD